MRLFFSFLTFTLFFSTQSFAEGYVGITQVSEYEAVEIEIPPPPKYPGTAAAPLEKLDPTKTGMTDSKENDKYKEKQDKLGKWTSAAYKLLNNGDQEKYDAELTRVYNQQVQEIRQGTGDGRNGGQVFRKFIEKKMPKIED